MSIKTQINPSLVKEQIDFVRKLSIELFGSIEISQTIAHIITKYREHESKKVKKAKK